MRKRIYLIIGLVGISLIGVFLYNKISFELRNKRAIDKIEEKPNTVIADNKGKKVYGLGVLEIPKINVKSGIVKGQSMEDMFYGVGWNPKTKFPERLNKVTGNLVLAAHDAGRTPIFKNLSKLEKGDEIYLLYNDKKFTYRVYDKLVVKPEEVWVEKDTKENILTLFTCTDSGSKRIVVRCKLLDIN